jgi:hypothetical protein
MSDSPDDARARKALGFEWPKVQGHGYCRICTTEGWLYGKLCGVCREIADWSAQNRELNDFFYKDVPGRGQAHG